MCVSMRKGKGACKTFVFENMDADETIVSVLNSYENHRFHVRMEV